MLLVFFYQQSKPEDIQLGKLFAHCKMYVERKTSIISEYLKDFQCHFLQYCCTGTTQQGFYYISKPVALYYSSVLEVVC